MEDIPDNAVVIRVIGFDSQGFPIRVNRVLEGANNETLILTFARQCALEFNEHKFGSGNGRSI